jgi:recombination protein RecA
LAKPRRTANTEVSMNIKDLASELTADFKKSFKDDSVTSYQDAKSEEVKTWYSTGIPTLDIALGGGLAGGQGSMAFGLKSSGKSTTSYAAIAANVQQFPDKIHVIADPENSAMDAEAHMIKLGVDLKAPNLIMIKKPEGKPLYAEDIFERIEALFRNPKLRGRLGLIVIDSIGALVSKHEGEKDNKWEKQARVGGLVSSINMFLRSVFGSGLVYDYDAHILFLNQVRDNIGDMWNPFRTPGGRQLEHCVVQMIEFSRNMGQDFRNPNYKEGNPLEGMYVGQRIKYRITKNKVGGKEGATATIDYYYDEGLDIYKNVIDLAEHVGLMTGGGWKALANPVTGEVIAKYQGINKWKDALHNDEQLWNMLFLMVTLAASGTSPEVMMQTVEEQLGVYAPTQTESTED